MYPEKAVVRVHGDVKVQTRRTSATTFRNTGHFLEMEHQTAWEDVRQAVEGFLLAEDSTPRLRRAS